VASALARAAAASSSPSASAALATALLAPAPWRGALRRAGRCPELAYRAECAAPTLLLVRRRAPRAARLCACAPVRLC
jgi:hypothetical protein